MCDKLPWILYPHIWKTRASFMSYLRGGIRKAIWNRYPIKAEFLKSKRIRIPNPNPRGKKPEVWGGKCELCNEMFVQKDLEVDHKKGHIPLNTIEDVGLFIKRLTYVGEDDLQLVCKGCHKVKSYAQSHKITLREAFLRKRQIAFAKLSSQQQRDYLSKVIEVPAKATKKTMEEMFNKVLRDE